MPPAIITPTLLKAIRSQPQLPSHSWYIVTSITLSALNRPDEIPKVFEHALETDIPPPEEGVPAHAAQLRIARKLREGLLKSSAVVGIPKTINALFSLKAATPPDLLDDPLTHNPTGRRQDVYDTPASSILERGQQFFNQIYGKVAKRIMRQMDQSGTEDLGSIARLVYGYILSNTNVLSAAETSFVLIAGLIPQDVNPQLKGHLKGALNNGASPEEVRAVREVVIKICEASGMERLSEDSLQGWGWRNEIANV